MAAIFHKYKRKQRGVALIVVMLIVALISIMATQMTSRLQLNIARTSNIKNNNQAYWFALGAEQFAKQSLLELMSLSPDNINLSQPWAQKFEYPIEGGLIRAQITDLQGCFNLNGVLPTATDNQNNAQPDNSQEDNNNGGNNTPDDQRNNDQNNNQTIPANANNGTVKTVTEAAKDALNIILTHYIEDSFVVDTLRDSIIDWIDDDDFQSDFGAEDANYESLPQPYLAANSMFANISEIRLVNGIEDVIKRGWLKELMPQLCVIPERNFKLNVNTVSEESAIVLAALLGITNDDATQIISTRPAEGFTDKENFLELPEVRTLGLRPAQANWFDVSTKYFKLSTQSSFDNGAQFTMVTVFKVNEDNTEINIVSREFGGI